MSFDPTVKKTKPNENEPELRLPSTVIYRHVSFTIEFIVSTQWLQKNRIRPEDILNAGLQMKLLKYRTGEEVKECTSCSKGRKVIEISVTNNQKFLEGKTVNDKRIFTFDKCRSTCSSSRNHLKDQLTLSITLSPDITIKTQPFSIRSRVLTQKNKELIARPNDSCQKIIVLLLENENDTVIETIRGLLHEVKDCSIMTKKVSELSIVFIHVEQDFYDQVFDKIQKYMNDTKEQNQGIHIFSSLPNQLNTF